MVHQVFTVSQMRPIRDAMTVSRSAGLGGDIGVTWFSLGAGTSISRESYDCTVLYLGAEGSADYLVGEPPRQVSVGPCGLLAVPGGMLCGVETAEGFVYTEILLKKESIMNAAVKPGEVMYLKDLISYEEGSIANLDIVHNDTMKFVLMAFDAGTGLSPHRAPGNAIVFALDGEAVIGYEGEDHTIRAGECFRFEKNGLHSVTANGRFKMALLLVLQE